jgi:hypothetical protein
MIMMLVIAYRANVVLNTGDGVVKVIKCITKP